MIFIYAFNSDPWAAQEEDEEEEEEVDQRLEWTCWTRFDRYFHPRVYLFVL